MYPKVLTSGFSCSIFAVNLTTEHTVFTDNNDDENED